MALRPLRLAGKLRRLSTAPGWSRRAVLAATVGNALEFYDFVTFAFFSVQIGRTFFPSGSAFLSLMGALATFGAGFLTRPLGAYILGGYADRVGRKPAMVLSFVLMAYRSRCWRSPRPTP